MFHLGAISATTFADADEMIAQQPQLLDRAVALVRGDAQDADLRLVGRDLWRRLGRVSTMPAASHALKRLRPLNLYGWSKHAFDLWAMRQAAAGTAPPLWAGLKFFNVFGPNEHHKGDMMSLVVKNYPRIIAGETIRAVQVAPPGIRRRRADARFRLRQGLRRGDAVAVAARTGRDGQRHLQSRHRQARSFLDLMRALGAACGVAPKIEFVDMPDAIRPNYQYFTQAEHEPAAPRRLQRPVHAARRRRARLRDAASVATGPVSIAASPASREVPDSGRSPKRGEGISLKQFSLSAGVSGAPTPSLRGVRGEGQRFIKTVAAGPRPAAPFPGKAGGGRRCRNEKWVGTWAAAPAPAEGVVGFSDVTLAHEPAHQPRRRASQGAHLERLRQPAADDRRRPYRVARQGTGHCRRLRPQAEFRRRATAR